MLLRSAASACTGPRGAVLLGYPAALQPRHRPKGGASLRVHRQRAWSGGTEHVLPARLQRYSRRSRLVRALKLAIDVRWSLLELLPHAQASLNKNREIGERSVVRCGSRNHRTLPF